MLNNWQKIIAMSPKEMAAFLADNTSSEFADKGCRVCEYKQECSCKCRYSNVDLIEKWLHMSAEEVNYMDTAQAFIMGERHKYYELMIFDWHKAAKIIKERKPKIARAGLRNDWEYTGGTIYEDGHIVKDPWTFLASTWAVPELNVDGEIIPCYIMESKNVNGWHEETRWPQSALDILNKEV